MKILLILSAFFFPVVSFAQETQWQSYVETRNVVINLRSVPLRCEGETLVIRLGKAERFHGYIELRRAFPGPGSCFREAARLMSGSPDLPAQLVLRFEWRDTWDKNRCGGNDRCSGYKREQRKTERLGLVGGQRFEVVGGF
jgi:hypothetical protein